MSKLAKLYCKYMQVSTYKPYLNKALKMAQDRMSLSHFLENRFDNPTLTPSLFLMPMGILPQGQQIWRTMNISKQVTRNASWVTRAISQKYRAPFTFFPRICGSGFEANITERKPQNLLIILVFIFFSNNDYLHKINMPRGPEICIHTDSIVTVTETCLDPFLEEAHSVYLDALSSTSY